MDRRLLIGAFALLFLEIFVLLADLGVLPIRWSLFSQKTAQKMQVGEMITTHQRVKRRSQNSILWESSEAKDKLFGFDSVLTLSQSSAQLKLQGDINIQLHENTLVVLEPVQGEEKDDFRLIFSKGTLLSQNKQKFQVKSKSWIIKAQDNSQLSLKSIGEENIEIEVGKGSVQVKNRDNPKIQKSFSQGQRVTFDSQSIQSVKSLSTELKWETSLDQRIYSHSFPSRVPLKWTGQATQLRIVSPDQKISIVDVTKESTELFFNPGTFYLSLENKNVVSPTLSLHLWHAPKIKYFSPLPRDRVKTRKEKLFSWSALKEATRYRLEISPNREFSTIEQKAETKRHILPLSVENEGLKFWRVFGIDDKGFEIPPYYNSRIYSVENPLAAPLLKAPIQRGPAEKKPLQKKKLKKNTSVWINDVFQYIFPQAHAQEPKMAIEFSWYPVPDADHYIIEVSSQAEFLNPEIVQTVTSERFVWSDYEKKPYYWRVAAGQGGRMGLFSEPARVDLSKISTLSFGELSPGVSILAPPPKKKKVPKPKPIPPKKLVEKTVSPPQKTTLKKSGKIWLSGSYHFNNMKIQDDFKTAFSGFAPFSVGAEFTLPIKDQSQVVLKGSYFNIEWKGDSEKAYPFQANLSDWQTHLNIFYNNIPEKISYGLSLGRITTLERDDLESIKVKNTWAYGVAVEFKFDYFKDLYSDHQLYFQYGNKLWNPGSLNSITYVAERWKENKIFVGGHFDIQFIFGPKSLSGVYGTTGIFTGLNW